MSLGEVVIFALAGVLAFLPAAVDGWALRRGASPETLIAFATVTLVGIAALPVAFTICTGGLAAHGGHDAPTVAAVAGLLLVAIAAGRALARVITIRRGWRALARVAEALELRTERGGARVLPVDELLAFVAGTEAFVSEGLLQHLSPSQRRAVIEHEREHARGRHARLLGAARALTHATFELAPARRAAATLDRELDVLADRAAARRTGDPTAVKEALRTLASETTASATQREDPATQRRLERLAVRDAPRASPVDHSVRVLTLAIAAAVIAAICLSIHTTTIWLGAGACALLAASVIAFTLPALVRHGPLLNDQSERAGDRAIERRSSGSARVTAD